MTRIKFHLSKDRSKNIENEKSKLKMWKFKGLRILSRNILGLPGLFFVAAGIPHYAHK